MYPAGLLVLLFLLIGSSFIGYKIQRFLFSFLSVIPPASFVLLILFYPAVVTGFLSCFLFLPVFSIPLYYSVVYFGLHLIHSSDFVFVLSLCLFSSFWYNKNSFC